MICVLWNEINKSTLKLIEILEEHRELSLSNVLC